MYQCKSIQVTKGIIPTNIGWPSQEAVAKANHDMKASIDQACRVSEEFTKVYYESMDKRRHLMNKLYLDSAKLVWNGNGANGGDEIQKFFNDLPASDHTLSTVDAQPVYGSAVGGQVTFVIQVSGFLKLKDKTPKSFQQNFMVTAQGDKWKIVTDCFRLQEPVSVISS